MKDTCPDCTFTVHHIQDVQLTCCSNRLETLAIRATISSEDVKLDAILTTIEQWVASKATLPGGDSALRLDKNNIVYEKCTLEQQNDEEDSSQTTDNVVIALFVIVIAAGIAAVIAGILRWRYLKKKKGSHTLER